MQRKLTGRSLEIGVLLDKEHENIAEFQRQLQEEGMRKWDAFRTESKRKMEALIEELGALENLNLTNYTIDGTYYEEHGLMFIVDNPEEEDPPMGGLANIIAQAMAMKKD